MTDLLFFLILGLYHYLTPAQTQALRGLLSAKELRLFDHLTAGGDPNIGEVCKACHTAVKTLLGRTMPSLEAKIEEVRKEIPEGKSQ